MHWEPQLKQFQSTLPVGGATRCKLKLPRLIFNFNPRSPWGERHILELGPFVVCIFQSTLPVGGATDAPAHYAGRNPISIHAPRGGSDTSAKHGFTKSFVISIHAPRGGSDERSAVPVKGKVISIHAPRGGSDEIAHEFSLKEYHFNPRSPWGERQYIQSIQQ